MHRHALLLSCLASVLSSLSAQSTRPVGSAPGDTLAYATASIRVRDKPAANAKELSFLGTGTVLRVFECVDGWCRVSIKNVTGYALQEYLTVRSVSTLPRDTVVYVVGTLRVRQQPAPNAKELALLAGGTSLRLHECHEGWCTVSIKKVRGYALEEYLTTQAPSSTTTVQRGRGFSGSPTTTVDRGPPAGATAKCRDGSYSFSRSRSGACSHHQGVAEWYR